MHVHVLSQACRKKNEAAAAHVARASPEHAGTALHTEEESYEALQLDPTCFLVEQ